MSTGRDGAIDGSKNIGDEDYDLLPLEYARVNGLCRDYFKDSVAAVHISRLQTKFGHDHTDDSHLPQLTMGPGPCINERLVLSQGGARFLQLVKQETTLEAIDLLILPLLSSQGGKGLKVELPLLRSDHGIDCKNFARREDFEIGFKDVRLPLEIVDEENGEGIRFVSKYWQAEQKLRHNLEKEKIEISKDSVAYLQTAIKPSWTHADEGELWDKEQTYKRLKALEPVTPPLSPFCSTSRSSEPSLSSPTYQLPILSDPESLTKEDLENIERYIFEQDIPTPVRHLVQYAQGNSSLTETYSADGIVRLADIYPPAEFMDHSTPPSVKPERVKREDLKVDESLTPPKPTTIGEEKVRFSEGVEQVPLNPTAIDEPEGFNRFFIEATFGKDYEDAMRKVEQEKLIEADATARVKERTMDFVAPDPPWKKFQGAKSPQHLLSLQKEMIELIVGSKPDIWRIPGRKQLDLRWNPFPHDLAKVVLEVSHQDDGQAWRAFVPQDDKQETDGSDLTWKAPGLRILKIDDGDDDEIELGMFASYQQQDMAFLVRKRKKELEHEDLTEEQNKRSQFQAQPQPALQTNRSTLNTSTTTLTMMDRRNNIEGNSSLLLGDDFSAGDLLENYKELRGIKKLKLMDSLYFPSKAPKELSAQTEPVPAISVVPPGELQAPMKYPSIQSPAAIPAPSLIAPATPINIIVSSTLLKHRALVRHLECLLPTLRLIERDFTAHNTTAWMPRSVTRSPKCSSLDSEADLIVSPSTGVILTTLQKVKQVPLPGSKTKTAIRGRLEKVNVRYGKLIVLVTEGRKDETTSGLSESDCIAMSEFVGFASGLTTAVVVRLVAGGEATLAKWVASTIVQHRLGEGEIDLLTEETHWELFLRRSGMNTFAAQVIVAHLKPPEGVDEKSPTKAGQFGMSAFVEMGREQRIKRFGGLCERRLVERVSDAIDSRWE